MALKNYDDLNQIQLDALREIGNIGSGNAATALSVMLSRPVNIAVPKIKLLDLEEVTRELGGPEEMIVGSLLEISDEVNGIIMFLMQKSLATMTMGVLLGNELEDMSDAGLMEFSAISEVANILSASYITAISSLTGLKINLSPPTTCIDMAGAILSVPAIHYGTVSDKIIFIQDDFISDNQSASGQILMFPDVESLNRIMENLGIGNE